jgi:hypothetical protein
MANRDPNSANQPAVSVGKQNPGCLVAFGLLYAVCGCIMSYFMLVQPLLNINAAQRWIETPCVIVSSKVGTPRAPNGRWTRTFSVDIVYDYKFNQQNFRSERYDFARGSTAEFHSKQKIVDRFSAGKKAVCYVNPQMPSQAVISRDLPIGFWFGMIPTALVVIGMIVAGIGFGLARKR